MEVYQMELLSSGFGEFVERMELLQILVGILVLRILSLCRSYNVLY